MNDVIEIKKINTLVNNESDDIFICAGSPEIRCLGTVRKLEDTYKTKGVFILRYSHKSERREKHLNEMRDILKNKGHLEEFVIDEETPIPIINRIMIEIDKYVDNPLAPKITIDISTIIKWHLLILLKALDLKGLLGMCRFLYTEPEEYFFDLFQPLSFGLKEIFPIPLYSGNLDFVKDYLVVIMLGYEGDRAMALLENIDPTECLLLVPKPAYHSKWEGRTEEMNKEIINIVGDSNIKYIHSRNPVLVAEQLKNILYDMNLKYNCLISPMGTKPQTFGLYLYWITNPANTSLIYSAPLRHNDLFYSKGIGRTWVLPVK